MNRLAAMLILAGVMFLTGCSRHLATKLEVGIIAPAFDHLPLDVALSARAALGPELRFRQFNSGWELGEAMVAGKLDVAIIPFTYVVSAAAQGFPVRIVSCLEREDDGIIARPGIQTLKQLAGRRIGCLKASTIELLLRRALQERNLEAQFVYFSSPMEMWSALERGDVDALSYYVPGIIKADNKIGRILYWYSQDSPLHPCCDVAVRTDRVRGKEKTLRSFLAALKAGSEIIMQDTAQALAVAKATYDLSDSVALLSLRHTPFRLALSKVDKDFELGIAGLMRKLGYISADVGADQLYLTGLVDEE